MASLPDYYEALFDKVDHCTDVVMFGDCRPVHKAVITGAKRRGKRIHVFEEGYFRPFWITLERDGVNRGSNLPRDPEWYRAVGKILPHYRNGRPFESSFFIRAWHDVQYHIWSAWNPIFYPGYETHAPYTAATEYLGYMRRASTFWLRTRGVQARTAELIESGDPFYFLPLQLDSDAQIREHSPFADMEEVMSVVMRSFALHAPSNAKLVIKNHPLDPGMKPFSRIVKGLEKRYDILGRTLFFETGNLPVLLDHAAGVITVNSTVGGSALVHKCPTITLADPIYNINGLTFQGDLDDFWRNGAPPDMSLFRRFRNTVIHTTQINGGFYSRPGIEMAVQNSLASLTSDESPLERLLEQQGSALRR
ncbi:MAG: capsular biosynthesis protein [Alcaligenaceae bacterium]|nr:MAG: capsular biosynthesis protein [Alcaligenaceae bacterium]